jgi:SAM-dependent methyltransferase
MSSEVKRREIQGYHVFARESGWAGSPENFMEKVRRGWKSPYFNFLLEIIGSKKGKLLDFAAGSCWTSYIFSKLGWWVVAVEMNASEFCGLGCVKNYKKTDDVDFEVVLGDCERSPVRDDTFDAVFCHQALHHAANLEQMVAEMARCAKQGGLVIAGGEHIRPFFTSDEEFRRRHPAVEFGANEHAYPYWRYKSAFRKAGLVGIRVIPRGFECNFDTIAQRPFRAVIRAMAKIPLIGERLVSFILLNFSGAGTEITIYGFKP